MPYALAKRKLNVGYGIHTATKMMKETARHTVKMNRLTIESHVTFAWCFFALSIWPAATKLSAQGFVRRGDRAGSRGGSVTATAEVSVRQSRQSSSSVGCLSR